MKKCTKCDQEKDLNEFPKCKRSKDGKYSWCKKCSADHANRYRLKNPEAYRASREKRKDAALAKAREWKKKNALAVSKYQKLYYQDHQEEILKNAKKWYQNISAEKKLKKREYYKKWSKSESAKKYNFTRRVVFKALQMGNLLKSEHCKVCAKKCKTEAHHADYEKPLEVLWVCRSCHGKIHRKPKGSDLCKF